MSRVFVDTSALFALVSLEDESHERSVRVFERLRAQNSVLLTTSYNLLETYAIVGRRLGRDAVVTFRSDVAPLFDVSWVDGDLHNRGLDLLLDRPSGVSLVDAVSFAFIRKNRVDEVFAFDRHFDLEGFPIAG